jgi:hypothetical protein
LTRSLAILGLYALAALGVLIVSRASGRRLPPLSLGLGFVLPIIFVWPCLSAGRTPLPVDHAMALPPWAGPATPPRYNENLNDAVMQTAPWQKAVRLAWKEGSLPLWNRWNGCGMPLAANGLSEAFSPLTILTLPLPLADSFTFRFLAKLFLAFCGMWLWLAEMRLSATAAAVGAVSFAFSLSMTGWLLLPHTASLCLWPWALFTCEVLRDPARRVRGAVLLIGILLLSFLGHPEIAALGVLLTALWVTARVMRAPALERRRTLAALAMAGLCAAGLLACLLIPQALAIADSNRARVALEFWRRLPFRLLPHGPLWRGYLTLFFPDSLGDGVSTRRIESLSPASFLETGLGYFGLAGWAAAVGLVRPGRPRRQEEWILLALAFVGAAVAMGCWPFFEVFLHLPLMRLTPPLRYLCWTSLAGAALAAFEVDRLAGDLEQDRRAILWPAGALAVLGLAALAVFRWLTPLYRAAGDLDAHRRAALLTGVFAASATLLLLIAAASRRHRLAGPLLVLLAFAELASLGRHLYRFGPPGDLFPPRPLLAFLQAQPPPFRVLGEGPVLFPNSNVFAGLEDIRTHDAVERRDYVDDLDRIAGYPPRDYFKFVQDVNAAGLDRLNVKFLVTPPDRAAPAPKWRLVYSGLDGRVFENTSVWPRIFARQDRAARDDDDRLTVTEFRETTNSVSFVAVVSGALEVTADTSLVSDGGWRARTATGAPLRVGRSDGPFLAFTLPPGTHRVTLSYRPRGFGIGLLISALTALALGAAAFAVRRRAGGIFGPLPAADR